MNPSYFNTGNAWGQTAQTETDSSKNNKTDIKMKNAAKEMKSILNRIPEILCFTFESYLLGYKYQELSEMAKMTLSSLKIQQENAEGLWSFKNWGKRK